MLEIKKDWIEYVAKRDYKFLEQKRNTEVTLLIMSTITNIILFFIK